LKIKQTLLANVIPYASNSRTHSDEQVSQIAASIKEFGFNNPILLDGDNGVIAGHGRVLAARKLGLDKVPTIELSHLTDTQRKAYVIADNKLALNSDWNMPVLALELHGLNGEGFNLDLIGFDADELTEIMFEPDFEPGSEDDQGRLDQKAPVTCPKCGHEFTP
jgi:ParB family transcriptional regulator, chromosome partitioning protein